MKTLINGKPSTQVSVSDRGLLYGQSLFETIAISNGKACLLDKHLNRLEYGCAALNIPFQRDACVSDISELIQKQDRAVLRVSQTMGVGGRGYLNPSSPEPSRICSLHPYPEHPSIHWEQGVTLGVADIRLSHQPALAGLKHGNRLEQTIARSQWQEGWQEALLLDVEGNVIEGTQSNIFVEHSGTILTPKLDQAGVAGVMREYIIEQLAELGISLEIVSLSLADIESADEVFLSNSVIGLWPVKALNSSSHKTFDISHKLLKSMIKNEVIPHY